MTTSYFPDRAQPIQFWGDQTQYWYWSEKILISLGQHSSTNQIYCIQKHTFGLTVANQYIGQTLIGTKNQDLLLLLWLLLKKKNLSQLHESAVLNLWSTPLSKENVTYSVWLSFQIPDSHDDLVIECFLSLYKHSTWTREVLLAVFVHIYTKQYSAIS